MPSITLMAHVLTSNQKLVLETLKTAPQGLTAQELYRSLKKQQHSIGLATVYRALKYLQQIGKLQTRHFQGEDFYSLSEIHCHYLICLHCNQEIPVIGDCPVVSLQEELAHDQNFKVFYHTLEIYGVCQNCIQQAMTPNLEISDVTVVER